MNKTKNNFKILSIDGGGIKGLYAALILKHLEEEFDCRTVNYFDLICGTSTGGLIALALSIGVPAKDIVTLYQEKGSKIFPRSDSMLGRFYNFIKQVLWGGKYSNNDLKNILREVFGDKVMYDADCLLNIPSFNLTRGRPRVFKYPHQEGNFKMDKDIKMVDVALATSAAPIYLPIYRINQALYVDGGVWANNPSITGLLEALDYFVGEDKEFDTYSLLSISTISQPSGWKLTNRKNRSFAGWRDKLLSTSFDGQAYFTNFFMEKIVNCTNPSGTYYRIPSPDLSSEQMKIISMDRTDDKAIDLLSHFGNSNGYEYRTKEKVRDFFKETKTYKTA